MSAAASTCSGVIPQEVRESVRAIRRAFIFRLLGVPGISNRSAKGSPRGSNKRAEKQDGRPCLISSMQKRLELLAINESDNLLGDDDD